MTPCGGECHLTMQEVVIWGGEWVDLAGGINGDSRWCWLHSTHRAIHDNILVTHEVMNKFHHLKGKQGYVALKLDMEKAYDRIERDFLSHCLQSMNFHPTWIAWIHECISTVSYSLLINNEACGFFKPTRGLRQGDPLYLHIYLYCAWTSWPNSFISSTWIRRQVLVSK